jgi:hypothetical protein
MGFGTYMLGGVTVGVKVGGVTVGGVTVGAFFFVMNTIARIMTVSNRTAQTPIMILDYLTAWIALTPLTVSIF